MYTHTCCYVYVRMYEPMDTIQYFGVCCTKFNKVCCFLHNIFLNTSKKLHFHIFLRIVPTTINGNARKTNIAKSKYEHESINQNINISSWPFLW